MAFCRVDWVAKLCLLCMRWTEPRHLHQRHPEPGESCSSSFWYLQKEPERCENKKFYLFCAMNLLKASTLLLWYIIVSLADLTNLQKRWVREKNLNLEKVKQSRNQPTCKQLWLRYHFQKQLSFFIFLDWEAGESFVCHHSLIYQAQKRFNDHSSIGRFTKNRINLLTSRKKQMQQMRPSTNVNKPLIILLKNRDQMPEPSQLKWWRWRLRRSQVKNLLHGRQLLSTI